MGLHVGTKEALSVHAGAVDALAVYRGSELVWESGGQPPGPDWYPPTSDLTNSCIVPELIGQAVTEENSAQGGNPWQTVTGSWTWAENGVINSDTAEIAILQWSDIGLAGPVPAFPDAKQSVGFWLTVNSPANGRIHDMRNSSNTVTYCGLVMMSGGIRALQGTTNIPESASPPLVAGRRYWVTYGCDNAVDGSHRLLIQNPDGSVFHDWTGPLAGTGDQIGFRRFGKVTTSAVSFTLAALKASSGISDGMPLQATEPVPIIRQSAIGRAEVTGDSFVVTLPEPTLPGNLVVLLLAGENTVTPNPPPGWTERNRQLDWQGHYVFDRPGAGDNSWTISTQGQNSPKVHWVLLEVTAGAFHSADGASGQNDNRTTHPFPSITPPAGRAILFASLSRGQTAIGDSITEWSNGFEQLYSDRYPDSDTIWHDLANRSTTYPGGVSISTTATQNGQNDNWSRIIACYTSAAP